MINKLFSEPETNQRTVFVSLVTAIILSWVPAKNLLMFSTVYIALVSTLFAAPIPPDTTYWANGLPAMCLSTIGVDSLFPALTIFVAQSLPPADQAIAGALLNSVLQISRAIGVAIATIVQLRAEGNQGNNNGSTASGEMQHNPAFLNGLRAAGRFDVGLGIAAFIVVVVAFRDTGTIASTRSR
jgi:hypothetical protein